MLAFCFVGSMIRLDICVTKAIEASKTAVGETKTAVSIGRHIAIRAAMTPGRIFLSFYIAKTLSAFGLKRPAERKQLVSSNNSVGGEAV